ncbi:MAG TPA: hypothetical protein VFZ89_05935 [Solirubrobacteraceae bacterium]
MAPRLLPRTRALAGAVSVCAPMFSANDPNVFGVRLGPEPFG